MTTNPFTEARAYAEQACYQDENIPIAEAGFRAGWKAARTHLAAQEPTEDEVRKAKAEAWDECERSLFRWFNDPFAGDEPPHNPYRETGDGDEHR